MTENSKGPALIDTNQCIVSDCTVEIPFGKGAACSLHENTGRELISSFGSGVPGDEYQKVPLSCSE